MKLIRSKYLVKMKKLRVKESGRGMDIQELIGHNVTHKSFGTGRILSVTETWIEVEFVTKGTKKVQFPQTFASYMRIDDEYLQSKIIALEEKRKADESRQKQIEAEKRAYVQAQYETKNQSNIRKESEGDWLKSKSSRSGITETKAEIYYYGEGIIGPKTSFATHADALNACFGFKYKHFQKAYKDLENGYAVWFPNIARKIDDQYISTDDYFGWINILSDSGDTITQIDKTHSEPGRRDNNKRVIFARFDNNKRYTFIGVFVFQERINNGHRYVRIGTIFDTKNLKIVE